MLTPHALLATWFGSGLAPKAPGTWGTLAALPFTIAIMALFGTLGLALFALTAFVLGLWAADLWERETGIHDDKRIVIDEVAGIALTLIPAGLNPILIVLGVILFRIFDIAKPAPVSTIDKRINGSLGVMLDDIAAAAYAGGILWIIKLLAFS